MGLLAPLDLAGEIEVGRWWFCYGFWGYYYCDGKEVEAGKVKLVCWPGETDYGTKWLPTVTACCGPAAAVRGLAPVWALLLLAPSRLVE